MNQLAGMNLEVRYTPHSLPWARGAMKKGGRAVLCCLILSAYIVARPAQAQWAVIDAGANASLSTANASLTAINTSIATVNTSIGTVNTSVGTVNTTLGTINTNINTQFETLFTTYLTPLNANVDLLVAQGIVSPAMGGAVSAAVNTVGSALAGWVASTQAALGTPDALGVPAAITANTADPRFYMTSVLGGSSSCFSDASLVGGMLLAKCTELQALRTYRAQHASAYQVALSTGGLPLGHQGKPNPRQRPQQQRQ